jgi:S1-C subfamily serine protease
VALDVFRPANNGSGKRMKVSLQPEEWVEPVVNMAVSKPSGSEQAKPAALGITVRSLTSELINQFGVEMTSGVIVTSVDKNTLAERKGIKPGDIITAINQQPVESPGQFREALAKADLKKGIIVNLVSAKTARFEILKEGEE